MLQYRRHSAAAALGIFLVLFLGLATYGFSMRLPFFADDLAHFRWLQVRSLASIWSSARGLSYYRPLTFSLWWVLTRVQGRPDAATLHGLSLGLHLLNAVLVAGLAASRGRHPVALGLSSALLFILFPFSYQAVPWICSLFHPLVTALVLGSLLLHVGASRRHSAFLRLAALGLALAAPFAHETGVLVAPLLLLYLLTDGQPLRKAIRQTLPYWLCSGLGLAIWLLIPKGAPEGSLLDLQSRWRNAAYFAQALAYPVTTLTVKLPAFAGSTNRWLATALLAAVAVGAWCLLLWRAGRANLLVLAVGWFVLSVAPSWALLPADYVEAGPRLLYLASVGASVFWASAADLRTKKGWIIWLALAGLVVIGSAAEGYRFIRDRVPLYDQVRSATDQLVEAISSAPAGPTLCVNYPMWFALRSPTYAIGSDGVLFVPYYTHMADLVWLETGQERPVSSVVFPDVLPHQGWEYIFPCVGPTLTSDQLQSQLRGARTVLVTTYGSDNLVVSDAGNLEAEGSSPAPAFLAEFDRKVALISATCQRRNSSLRVELRWQCWGSVGEEASVFVHLYDEQGKLVSQADGYPLMGTSRILSWRPGDEWRDVRLVQLPSGTGPHQYSVKVGLYATGGAMRRFVAESPGGQRFQDDAVAVATLNVP